MFTGSSRGNPHVPGDETTRLAGRKAGVAIRMRGQPHVRGSSTDGRNPNLIPREHKDKATSAVEWGLRRPRGKGRRRWKRKKSEQEERAHSKQRQRSAEENSFRSNQGVLLLRCRRPPRISLFLVLIFIASNSSVRDTSREKIVRMYAYARVSATALPCFPWLLLFPLLCSLVASGQEEAGGRTSECHRSGEFLEPDPALLDPFPLP